MVALQTNPPTQRSAVNILVPQSPLMACGALVLAFGLHAALSGFMVSDTIDQAGGNTALAAQGSSFANLAVGVDTPEPVEQETQEQVEVEPPLAPVKPQEIVPVQPIEPEIVEPVARIEAVEGGVPLIAAPAEDRPTELPAQPALASPIPEAAVEVVPETVSAPEVEQQPAADKPEAAKPQVVKAEEVRPEEVQLDVQPEVQPPEPQSPPVLESLRPPERPQQPEPEPVRQTPTAPVAKPAPQPAVTKPRGNGEVNATRGVATSTRTQPGGQARSTGGAATVQGNAAVDNYPGQVMRRIQRAKRRANVRGTAIVRFSIAASGALAGVSIARSSGSAKLDGIALAQVRRAAPFAPPPAGAKRSFTVRIKGN